MAAKLNRGEDRGMSIELKSRISSEASELISCLSSRFGDALFDLAETFAKQRNTDPSRAAQIEEGDVQRAGQILFDLLPRETNHTYEVQAVIVPEDEGGFHCFIANLPGVVSQGDTEPEAWANIEEAAAAVLGDYLDSGQTIPWCQPEELPTGAKLKQLMVHAQVADSDRA
jgi:predicted RNase H-like HicB family nuclease